MKSQEIAKQICSQYSKAKSERASFDSVWEDAFFYTKPLRGQQFLNKNTSGEYLIESATTDQAELFDGIGAYSVNLLATSIITGLVPASSQWFNIGIQGVIDSTLPHPVRIWLEQSAKILHDNIHNSNFDSATFELFTDVVIAGGGGLFIRFDEERSKLIFEYWPLYQTYFLECYQPGIIDTVFRSQNLTAKQAVEQYGYKNVPDCVRNSFDQDPDNTQKDEYVYCVRPRTKGKRQSYGNMKSNMPWASYCVHVKTQTIVHESGFQEFPLCLPRWQRTPESAYPVGAVHDCLPDLKSLNLIRRDVLTNAEMQIAGTFKGVEDGVLNPKTATIGPRQIIMLADINNLQPLEVGGDMNFAEAESNILRANIRRALFADQLQPNEGPQMTATEVQTRTQLIRRVLGPIYAKFQTEFLQPLIERTFGLCLRNGLFGQVPVELVKMNPDLVPEYQSPLARAQRQEDLDAIIQYEQILAQTAQINPEVMDLYNWDEAAKVKSDILGVPSHLMRTKKEVETTRKERAKAQQQAMAMQLAQQSTPTK